MITLTLTPQELAVINRALMLAPYGEVAPVIQSINQQLQKAQDEHDRRDGSPTVNP
jgi:hypothetical protein